MATKKKVKSKKKPKLEVFLELNGSVNIVEVNDGVRTKTPIDGDTVLRALLLLLERSVKEALSKDEIDDLAKQLKKKKSKK